MAERVAGQRGGPPVRGGAQLVQVRAGPRVQPAGGSAAIRCQPAKSSASRSAAVGTCDTGLGVSAAAIAARAASTAASSSACHGVAGCRPSTSVKTSATHSPSSYQPSSRGVGAYGGSAAAMRASARCRMGLSGVLCRADRLDERPPAGGGADPVGGARRVAARLGHRLDDPVADDLLDRGPHPVGQVRPADPGPAALRHRVHGAFRPGRRASRLRPSTPASPIRVASASRFCCTTR